LIFVIFIFKSSSFLNIVLLLSSLQVFIANILDQAWKNSSVSAVLHHKNFSKNINHFYEAKVCLFNECIVIGHSFSIDFICFASRQIGTIFQSNWKSV